MSAGRPLEPAGNGRPRWMAAAGTYRQRCAPRTESGVQVDSSVAHQVSRRHMAVDLVFLRALLVVVGHLWLAFDGPVTAQTAEGRPRRPLVCKLCALRLRAFASVARDLD
jgi:hypothetical protein